MKQITAIKVFFLPHIFKISSVVNTLFGLLASNNNISYSVEVRCTTFSYFVTVWLALLMHYTLKYTDNLLATRHIFGNLSTTFTVKKTREQ